MATDTKSPGEKLSVTSKTTLTLKPRAETGVVRQSFSHGRSKAVVVEKVRSALSGRVKQSRPRRRPRLRVSAPRRVGVVARGAAARAAPQRPPPRRTAAEALRRRAAHAHRGRAEPPRPCAGRRQGARGRRAQDRRGRGEDPRSSAMRSTARSAMRPKRASATEEERRRHDEETKRKADEVAKKRFGGRKKRQRAERRAPSLRRKPRMTIAVLRGAAWAVPLYGPPLPRRPRARVPRSSAAV